VTGDGVARFGDIAAGGFQFAQHSAGARQKGFTGIGEANGAAEAVKEASAEFGFEF